MTPNSSRALLNVKTTAILATLALLSVADTSEAQTWDVGGAHSVGGFHQPSARRNMVRFGTYLYCVVVQSSGHVQIRRKADDTVGGWSNYVSAVNTTSTGISLTLQTTTVAMAVSRQGCLHITWGRHHYPTFFKQYYRAYLIGSGFTHTTPQDISALVGASTTTRTDSMAIAVSTTDRVYLTAPINGSNWRSQLLESQFLSVPPAIPAPQWTNRGAISGNAYSSQNVRMVVDTVGRVQLSFYNNIPNGRYATRVFTSPSTWGTMEFIGTPPYPRDDSGYLATDYSRFTHVLYKHLVSKVGTLITYQLLYRRRFGILPWSAPIVVDTFTSAEHAPDIPHSSYALSATLKGDRVFAIYRDYRCKRLMLKQKKYGATSFEFLAELQPKSPGPMGTSLFNDYIMPNVRNTLSTTNGLVQYLDITFRRPFSQYYAPPSYRLYHQRLQVGAIDVDQTGCAGFCGVPAMTYGGVPQSSVIHKVDFGVERARPGATAFLLWETSPITVPFAGCFLHATNILTTKTVNACCNAKVRLTLPGTIFGFTLYNQWAVIDSAAIGGWALSNRGKVVL
jgi:hypothetical protein